MTKRSISAKLDAICTAGCAIAIVVGLCVPTDVLAGVAFGGILIARAIAKLGGV
jgi:orotate phosphoribosyltransferase